MVLFGFRRRSSRLATIFAMCGYCRTPSAHALTRRRRYFTLFFVPIIPMGAKHFTSCTMCGTTSRISKEASDHYLFLLNNAPKSPSAPPAEEFSFAGAPGPASDGQRGEDSMDSPATSSRESHSQS
jgi:hypothetical protein